MADLPTDNELIVDDNEALTVSEVIAAYDALIGEIAKNDRTVIARLLRSPNLSPEERAAIVEWGVRTEALAGEFLLRNFAAGQHTQ